VRARVSVHQTERRRVRLGLEAAEADEDRTVASPFMRSSLKTEDSTPPARGRVRGRGFVDAQRDAEVHLLASQI